MPHTAVALNGSAVTCEGRCGGLRQFAQAGPAEGFSPAAPASRVGC